MDLERVAERMLPLLEEVYQLGIEAEDLFKDELTNIEQGIKDYPEWMGAESSDPCILESAATRCVLTWQWLNAEHYQDL